MDLNIICKNNTLDFNGLEALCSAHGIKDYMAIDSHIHDITGKPYYEFNIYEVLDYIYDYAKCKGLNYFEFNKLGFNGFRDVVNKIVKHDWLCEVGEVAWSVKWDKNMQKDRERIYV